MAPEQLEGREADARTDIFAFGAVVYEMVTGKKAFEGTSQATLISSIMSANPPPIATSQPLTPAAFDRLVRKCLVKDRDDRWQTARDVEHALELVAHDAPDAPSGGTPSRSLRRWRGVAALMTLIAVGLVVWAFWPKTGPPAHLVTLQASLPENARLDDSADTVDTVSVSPDGRKLVIAGGGKKGVMWIRDLETLEWKPLPGTEGGANAFWSPDSRFLAFAAGNQIRKVDVSGGPPQTLCTSPTNLAGSGAWNQDGLIVFGSTGLGAGGPLWKISQAGGAATAITTVEASSGELFHSQPSFLPDGKHFLYFRGGAPAVEGVYVGTLDAKPGEQSRERILVGRFAASYANGYLFFMRENTLMAQPFNAGRLQLLGEPVPMADPVSTTWYSVGLFSISPSGVLAYRPGTRSGRTQLTWLDGQGKILSAFGQPGTDAGIALSPDGTRGVVLDNPSGQGDLWTLDFARGSRTRLTFDGRTQLMYGPAGVWSQDGSRIAFAAGSFLDTLYEKASSGAGEEKELLKEPNRYHVPTSWSRDGRFLLYHTTNTPQTGDDLWVLPLYGDRKPVLLLGTPSNEWAARFSPDMRWIAYNSNETGRAEVFVRPFLAAGPSGSPSLGEGKWQVSRDGGRFPRWRPDGKEILFEDTPLGTGKMAVEVEASDTAFEYGVPHELFHVPVGRGWDSADGKRFLVAVPPIQPAEVPITVVLNWTAALKK
jgi:Tol biopolymer transport system component